MREKVLRRDSEKSCREKNKDTKTLKSFYLHESSEKCGKGTAVYEWPRRSRGGKFVNSLLTYLLLSL